MSGGELPYTWTITQGSLPAGLTLNSTSGHISGITNLAVGQSSVFTIKVTDSGHPVGWDETELVIYVINPLVIVTDEIQGALQKAFYQATLQGEGGVMPHHWSILNGSLPEGLTLEENSGVISGTPLECGGFNFTVRLQDSAPVPNTDTHTFSLDVLCCNDYDITGTVHTEEGVLMTLTGDATATTTTNAQGEYTFEHLPNGTYTITPSKQGYVFNPASANVTVNNHDVSGVDFMAYAENILPKPDIKANGSDGPVSINVGENLSVTIELAPGNYQGYQADWWCVADTPFGWYYYDYDNTGTWLPGFIVSYQGPLFEITPPYEVLNTSDLPTGNYTFYFGVDGNRNGNLDEPLYYDSVEVTITP